MIYVNIYAIAKVVGGGSLIKKSLIDFFLSSRGE